MNHRHLKDQIRSSLKSTLFPQKLSLALKEETRNVSPPQQNVPPLTDDQECRHFHDSYTIRENEPSIGEGAHAVVQRCYKLQSQDQTLKSSQTKLNYAVKVFRTGDPEIVNTIRQTFNLHRTLNDLPFVVKAFDLFINAQKEELHLVMEYCPYQSLETIINEQIIPENKIKLIALQLAQAIDVLHQRGISHRDLKPDNILLQLSENSVDLKIIDFGVSKRFMTKAKQVTKTIDMWTRTGTLFYQAPEIFKGGGYNEKIDIWSAGVILYQLICGTLPFQFETILETIEQICDPDFNVENTANFDFLNALQQDLLKRLLKKDPEKRLSAKDFSMHPWLHTVTVKKQNKSFDDSDISDSRDMQGVDFSQSTQLYIKQCFTNQQIDKQQLFQINEQDDTFSDSRKNSWKNQWGNHVHVVPQKRDISRFTLSITQLEQEQQKGQQNGNSVDLGDEKKRNSVENGSKISVNEINVLQGIQRTQSFQFHEDLSSL